MEDRAPEYREPGPSGPLRAKLRRATELIIAVRREGGEELRADVLADIKDVLTGSEPSMELIEVPGEPEPQVCISNEGIYRAVLAEFGLDRSDPYVQESVWELVRWAVDEVLGGDARDGAG